MNRKMKALGLALIAAFAMSAVAAAGASAAEFTSEEYPVVVSGSTETSHDFTAGEGLVVSCTDNEFVSNEYGAATSALMVDPTYENCEFAGLPATVDFTGCSFEFYPNETADLSCPTGKSVDISVFLDDEHVEEICRITVIPTIDTKSTGVLDTAVGNNGRTYGPFSVVDYTNNENGTVTVDANVEEQINFEYIGALCPDEEGKVFENGSYEGSVTVSGNNGAIDVE
jgi:hypothetical protein